jgi:hypothetical protein
MKYMSNFACFPWPYHPPPVEKETRPRVLINWNHGDIDAILY